MKWVGLNFRFLRMNCINKYNNKMGGVGISDKYRNYYRIYFGVRKRKWWWYIFFWDVVVILTNAYIIYICIHNMNVNPRKHVLSNNDLETQYHVCVQIRENIEQRNL